MSNKIKYKKSNHKHLYDDCLLVCAETDYMVIKGRYCKKCGKIMVGEFLYNRLMTEDEAKEIYPNAPLSHTDKVLQKYVDEEELI